jgi:translation initiation factor 1
MRLFAGTEFDQPPHCDRCGELESECQCPEPVAASLPPEKQSAKIRLEKRKKGKWVTTVSGLDPTAPHLTELLTKLKNHCGAGGTIHGDVLEIQGDHVERVSQWLKKSGYRVAS